MLEFTLADGKVQPVVSVHNISAYFVLEFTLADGKVQPVVSVHNISAYFVLEFTLADGTTCCQCAQYQCLLRARVYTCRW